MKLALVNVFKDFGAPPMGLVYLATYLKEYANFEDTKIIDVNVHDVFHELKRYKPDLIGISAMTVAYNRAIQLANKIKQDSDLSEVPILIGGVHISTLPTSLDKSFDIGIVGEGEQTLLELVQLYEKYGAFEKNQLQDIKGIVYHNKGKLVITEKRELITPLDKLPIPDRSFLDPLYFEPQEVFFTAKYGRVAHILTTRGCPYKCVFCSTTMFWQTVRAHSVEHVYNEVAELVDKYKVDSIQIWDDLFTYNKKRLREIVKIFKENRITEKVQLSCQSRANLVDDELCGILKELNIKCVGFGFESGSEKNLKYLKKGSVKVEQNINAAKICKRHGFKVMGSLMFGSPGETIEDMKQTLAFIDTMKEIDVDLMWAFVTTPFPGTEIWKIAKERGVVSEDMDWDQLNHSNIDNPMVLDPSVDIEEFKKVFEDAKQKIFVNFEMDYWKRPMSWMIKQGLSNPQRGFQVLLKIIKKGI
jgi:radical SAM superfamily enzyme YgiQ (UPF0313 family)